MAQPALAADECGTAPAGGTVTCTAAASPGVVGNPYPNGITYAAPTDALTVILNADTLVNAPANVGVNVSTGAQNQTITAAAGSSVTTDGIGNDGYRLFATSGNVTATTGTIRTTGGGASGIYAATGDGNVTLVAHDTGTTGQAANGITATAGSGSVAITTGTVSTTGLIAHGVFGESAGGTVTITGGNVSTSGDSSIGIWAQNFNTGTAAITGGTVTTTGAGSTGVRSTVTGSGAASAAPASVTTSGDGAVGILVSTDGAATAGSLATTVATGNATGTTGAGSHGIQAFGGSGTTVNYASITTRGAGANGVLVGIAGPTVVINGATTGLLSTTGAGSDGITATAAGDLTVNVGRVGATGAGSRGIVATSTAGTVNVTSTGVVADGDAVTATNTGGAANVTLRGTNNSVTGSGAVVDGSTTAGLNLTGGTLNGAVNGATLTSATSTTVTNSGTITGTNAALVTGGAGAATINNTAAGTITGRILLGAGNDTVNNAGTFNANASSNFGAGTNAFNNSGTLRVLPAAVTPGTVTMTGLTTFNNNGGLIDLRNGHTGDSLVLPGSFTGSGASTLAVDVSLAPAPTSADTLQIGGTASGSTAVLFNRLDTGPAILSTAAGTTIVQAGAASSANAFFVAPALQVNGVIQYGIVYNPTTFAYALVSAPSAAAYRTSLFGDGVRNLWLQSADAWTAHMRELRDTVAANGPDGAGGRFWFQGFGQWEKRARGRTVSYNGITSNVDFGYDQDYYGFQLGMDLGTPAESGFNFGVTAGYQNSNMSFPNVADRIHFNAVNAGLYASFKSGVFFINALGKYDYYWGENRSPAGLYAFDIDGSVWGAKAEAGLRFGQDFFVEPAVSIAWTSSDFGSFTVPSGSFAIDDEDGLRGKAGARLGWTTNWGGTKLSLYGGANYVHEFRGQSNVVFTSGGQVAAFHSPHNQDYGEGILGVNVGSEAGKISGFFEGRYAEGNDYDGYGVRGGIRVRF